MAWKPTDRKFEMTELKKSSDPPKDDGLWLIPLLLWLILLLGGATLNEPPHRSRQENDRSSTLLKRSSQIAIGSATRSAIVR